MNMSVQSTGHHPIIDWIKAEAGKVAKTVEADVEKQIMIVRGQIADYIKGNAQGLADKVKDFIEKTGSAVEAEMTKAEKMIQTDLDTAIQTLTPKIEAALEMLGLDKDTADKVIAEVQGHIDDSLSKGLSDLTKMIQNVTDKESSAIDAKIVSFIDELAVKVRGKIVG